MQFFLLFQIKFAQMASFFAFSLILLSLWGFNTCNGRIFTLEMHHRFSEPVKKLSESAGKHFLAENWPVRGSVEYYAQLANHDQVIRGRRLSEFNGSLTFSEGNSTFRINSLGFLHYTTVSLGTPSTKFLVALDTGSDLFWVPCDCSRCAPTEDTPYSSEFELSIYSPKGSSTSKKVTCTNSLCAHRNRCLETLSHCPYTVSYVSSETSTSGILVEDVLHLRTEDNDQEFIEAYIMFGCGQVQTGSFLDVAAPNGLFGLGLEKISVPSILSREGYTADSFSMCFGSDGTGRINFGDKGSLDQDETPFNLNPLHPTYNVTVTQTRVGTTIIDLDFTALFDSGTSFTYLVDAPYTRLSESFHLQAQDRRRPPDSRIPFEYCYDMSSDANTSLIPTLSLTMAGGGQLAIFDPIIVISMQQEVVYCLAVVKSAELNIIGQNFMTGYRIVFDREKLVLGWKKFDCYDTEDNNTFPTKSHNSTTVPPAVAVGLDNHATPNSTRETRNSSVISVASPFYHCHFSDWTYSCLRFLFILLLLLRRL
ncbi:aspartyl protease family protein 1-like [Cornus florida]|uniref:aspartyl protease family protein 1-like n=1 Tax=Cornus florida TaxID=4283 RepID=UPI0028A0C465|nr:aspartyl protease family protein 1-like [Cornus florida]